MSDFILSCSSPADLTKEQLEELDVNYIYFHFQLDGKDYYDDLGATVPYKDFFDAMRNGAMTKTSQINVEEYYSYFEGFLKEGKDILHITLSSGISGTYNSAMIAKSDLEEKYPDRKIYVVDSLTATGGYALLVKKLALLKKEGKSIEECNQWAIDNRLNIQAWIFTGDLTYLIRGGRVSKTSGTIGNLLNICPMLTFDREGKLDTRYKIRGKKKVIKAVVDKVIEQAYDHENYADEIFINHADNLEDANAVIDALNERMPNVKDKITLNWIGNLIGSHTGPGLIGVFFFGNRED